MCFANAAKVFSEIQISTGSTLPERRKRVRLYFQYKRSTEDALSTFEVHLLVLFTEVWNWFCAGGRVEGVKGSGLICQGG